MRELGIACGADLQARSEQELVAAFGRVGGHYWRIAMAQDGRPVEPDRPRRSLSVETTFDRDLREAGSLEEALAPLADELAARVERAGFPCRTLTLKVRYADFAIASRRTTRATAIRRRRGDPGRRRASCWRSGRGRTEPIRLLGLGVSSPADEAEPRQLGLPLTAAGSAGR